MEFTQLGRTGLKVSRLCLGTMNFGPQTTEADSFGIMDKAHELGINFFDTANVYGWKLGEGVTEGEIKKWLVKEGDTVVKDQALAEVETDKAVVEMPSPDKVVSLVTRYIVPVEPSSFVKICLMSRRAKGTLSR